MTDLGYLVEVVWSQNSSSGRAIVLLLLLITLSALACVLRHWRRYSSTETPVLVVARMRLKQLGEAAEKVSPTSKPADAKTLLAKRADKRLIDIGELARGLAPDTLVGDRLATIVRLRKSQVKVNLAALQQITGDRESSRASLRFPEFAIGLLMMLGLFGTFVGIATTFQAVGPDITASTVAADKAPAPTRVQAVERRVQTAFAGMRTKFSASLVGLAGAILLSLMNLQLGRVQGRFLSDLERFTVVELLPATIPSVEDELLLDRVSRQLDEGFTNLEAIAQVNVRTMQEIAGIQAGFGTIVENITRATRADTGDRLQAVIGQLSDVVKQVAKVNETVRGLTLSLPTALDASALRIERAFGVRAPSPSHSVWNRPMTAMVGVSVILGLLSLFFATR